MYTYQEKRFSFGNATSLAPIMMGRKIVEIKDSMIEEDIRENPRLYKSLRGASVLIAAFCERYQTRLKRVTTTLENTRRTPKPELAYEFSDKLGLYTIEGIRNSL